MLKVNIIYLLFVIGCLASTSTKWRGIYYCFNLL